MKALKPTNVNCHNEKHETPWSFKTIIDKTEHLIQTHSCPLVKCSFYCEFDAEMIQHMDCVHEKPKQSCHICKLKVPFLADHLFSHPQYSVCTIIFMDLAALHEPQCGTVTNAGSVQITDEDNSLNIDTGNSEIDFVKTLHTILDRVSLDSHQ